MSSRVATVSDPDGNVLSYTYDACGARASMSLTVGTTTVTDLDYTYTVSIGDSHPQHAFYEGIA